MPGQEVLRKEAMGEVEFQPFEASFQSAAGGIREVLLHTLNVLLRHGAGYVLGTRHEWDCARPNWPPSLGVALIQ